MPLEITSVSVPDLLMDIQRDTLALQDHSGLIFVWRVDEPLPLLQTDAGKLKIVLKNLFGNAIKFTEQGTVTIQARSQENGVEIKVQDTGRGLWIGEGGKALGYSAVERDGPGPVYRAAPRSGTRGADQGRECSRERLGVSGLGPGQDT